MHKYHEKTWDLNYLRYYPKTDVFRADGNDEILI